MAADIDADGRADLLVADRGSHTLHVLSGRGNGTFLAPLVYLTNVQGPMPVVVADYDGDGRPDALVGAYGSAQLGLLSGLGCR